MVSSVTFSLDGRLIVSGSEDDTIRVWDMTDGSSKTLAITDHLGNFGVGVPSVAISSNGWLVAAGSYDSVRHFPNCLLDVSNALFRSLCVSGTFVRVNCWKSCRDTRVGCLVWHSPLMPVG